MKTFAILLLLLMFCKICRAEDALVSGGKSPNGRYEVRIYKTDPGPDLNYEYRVFDIKKGKLLKKLDEPGGYSSYDSAVTDSKVYWNSSSDLFALLDQSTRHSIDLYVYKVAPSSVITIALPDYQSEAIKRIGAKESGIRDAVSIRKWKGNSLDCAFDFDAEVDGDIMHYYGTEFVVTFVSKGNKMALTRMDQPDREDQ